MQNIQQFKYAEGIAAAAPCPSGPVTPAGGKAFRFVHNQSPTSTDFEPPACNRGRYLSGKPPCGAWGLSFFRSREKAVEFIQKRAVQHPKYPDNLGRLLAEVDLAPAHGVGTKPRKRDSHFDLFEFTDATFVQAVQAVGTYEVEP